MVDKILAEIRTYKENKENYSALERVEIKKSLRKKLAAFFKNAGDKIIDEIDSINHQ